MDDLVRTGTIAVAGLYTLIILIIAGLISVVLWLWGAWMKGNSEVVLLGIAALILASLGYIITGIWLRRTGCI